MKDIENKYIIEINDNQSSIPWYCALESDSLTEAEQEGQKYLDDTFSKSDEYSDAVVSKAVIKNLFIQSKKIKTVLKGTEKVFL